VATSGGRPAVSDSGAERLALLENPPIYSPEFGISGLPFQLSPDPCFNFDSRGHRSALATLRRALADELGFIVVSGDVGAGKTTLMRTLLAELDGELAAVSHIVSAQLDATELLAAALLGFGIRGGTEGADTDALASTLLRFLIKLDKQGRRGVLVIDEAQNLHAEALVPLMQLVARQTPRRLPLQVCLAGQPELKTRIDSAAGQSLRHLIAASCVLGPLEREEIGAYIEQRLRRVGWNGTPRFEAGAFDEIFRRTNGIARRINLLCHRLLLSCTLARETTIGVDKVAEVARNLCTEIGGVETLRGLPALAMADRQLAAASRVNEPRLPPVQPGGVLCVVAGCGEHVKAAALMEALARCSGRDAATLVRIYDNEGLRLSRALFKNVEIDRCVIELRMPERAGSNTDDIGRAFDALIERTKPGAVVVFDGSAEALACATVAKARNLFVAHFGAGLRTVPAAAGDRTRMQTDRLADLLYTTEAEASQTLIDEGLPPERIHFVGSLLVDALHLSAPGPNEAAVEGRPAYALVVLSESVNVEDRAVFQGLATILRDVSRDIVLVWAMQQRVQAAWKRFRLERLVPEERITLIPAPPQPAYTSLLRGATCVLTDSWNVQEEAAALGIPCLTLGLHPARSVTAAMGSNVSVGCNHALATHAVWRCLFNGSETGRVPALWDGKTGSRIAGYLSARMPTAAQATAPVV
jgi:general secretion pathway protein A